MRSKCSVGWQDLNPDIFLAGKRRFKTRTHWHSVVRTVVDFGRKKA